MKLEYWLRRIFGCSLLRLAKIIMGGYAIVFIVVFVLMVTSCSNISIEHRDGKKPRLKVESDYVDDLKVRIKHDGIIVYMEWEI